MLHESAICETRPAWLSHLNDKQYEAVTLPLTQHGAIIAGAGSGKTSVLTHRIAYAIQQGIEPESIMAVTFTNKASKEIKERIAQLVGQKNAGKLKLGTFHSLGLRFLRLYGKHIGLLRCESVSPMDTDEAVALMRRVMKDKFPDIDLKTELPRTHYETISRWKDNGLYVSEILNQRIRGNELSQRLFPEYENEKRRSQTIDFADLILQSNRILQSNPEIAKTFQRNLKMVLVDEFQDTNPIQVEFIRHLTDTGNAVPTFVVGDDDQSIYGWRGAEASVMQHFIQDYTPTQLVRLEQNYRCPPAILSAANAVIANNTNRISKSLWTTRTDKGIFRYDIFDDEDSEAIVIADNIKKLIFEEKVFPSDIVVLYRKSRFSRSIERALSRKGLAYQLYGGTGFFQRKEIKDAIAWLRVVQNPDDDSALLRAISNPPRGAGEKTTLRWHQTARNQGISLWDTLQEDSSRAASTFINIINELQHIYQEKGLVRVVKAMLEKTSLGPYYIKVGRERGEEAAENLQELVAAAGTFNHEIRASRLTRTNPDNERADILAEFISEAMLNADSQKIYDPGLQAINLMTVHKAKGLEFPYVFVIGMEEGEFPHISRFGYCNPEEERRLFYVAMTRAKLGLFLSSIRTVNHFGGDSRTISRFVEEIPGHLMENSDLVQQNQVQYRNDFNDSDEEIWF